MKTIALIILLAAPECPLKIPGDKFWKNPFFMRPYIVASTTC